MLLALLIFAETTAGNFETKLEKDRRLDAGTGVGALVIMDLSRAAKDVCSLDDWPERVDAFAQSNKLTDDETLLLGHYCIQYGHGAIAGASNIVSQLARP